MYYMFQVVIRIVLQGNDTSQILVNIKHSVYHIYVYLYVWFKKNSTIYVHDTIGMGLSDMTLPGKIHISIPHLPDGFVCILELQVNGIFGNKTSI